ncbi:hypothetical protein C1H46_030683 [Malus baccata]|uniref:GST C-terminal domain-containing protein n=1 Tax=Malus baccata TaxID=106549 RepID=A0A540LB81_MALBA|nr:hypothetical protein C1H46_030683 [Malus baccata]
MSRCGFAQSQKAYDTAVNELFDTLDTIEDHLSCWRYLCGDELTHADVCLFTTLTRFDLVYNVLFRCTKKKLLEYTNLHATEERLAFFYRFRRLRKLAILQLLWKGTTKPFFR